MANQLIRNFDNNQNQIIQKYKVNRPSTPKLNLLQIKKKKQN